MSYMSSTGVGKVPYTLGERFKPTARLEMSAESWDSLKLLLDRIMPARLWCRRLRLLRGPARLSGSLSLELYLELPSLLCPRAYIVGTPSCFACL